MTERQAANEASERQSKKTNGEREVIMLEVKFKSNIIHILSEPPAVRAGISVLG